MIGRFARKLKPLLNVIYPERCVFCSAEVETADFGHICETCRSKLVVEYDNRCLRCGAAVGPYARTDKGCVHCRKRKLRFDGVTCLGMYDEAMRRAILAGKWGYSSTNLRLLTRLLIDQWQDTIQQQTPELIIPIPQHLSGRFGKNFNSAAVIGHELANSLSLKCDEHILRRRRTTKPQKRVTATQRFENQKNTFRLRDQHLLKQKNVLLVDDVMTTGATCSEAASVLKAAGARKVHVVLLGRVLNVSAPQSKSTPSSSTEPAP